MLDLGKTQKKKKKKAKKERIASVIVDRTPTYNVVPNPVNLHNRFTYLMITIHHRGKAHEPGQSTAMQICLFSHCLIPSLSICR